MTTIRYECVKSDGEKCTVKTYEEAENIRLSGGSYKTIFNSTLSESEGYSRVGARRAGELK